MGRLGQTVRFFSRCLVFPALLVACNETEPAGPTTGKMETGQQATTAAVAPEPLPATQTTHYIENTLKWQTASESGIFGFHVYRGDSENGPFHLLNSKPVSAAGTTDEYQQYQFLDKEAIPGKTYYYYLEKLEYNNRRKRYSPVFPYDTPVS